MIEQFIEKQKNKRYISDKESENIHRIIKKYIENIDSDSYILDIELIPKQMDECRRVFKTNKELKVFLQYINFLMQETIEVKISSCNYIVSDIIENQYNYKYLKKIDISKYFDTIDRSLLNSILTIKLNNEKELIIKVIQNVFCAMDTSNEMLLDKKFNNSRNKQSSLINVGKGIPQGLPISNILSILYLDDIDSNKEIVYKYIDDIFVLSNNKADNTIIKGLKDKKLKINMKKYELIHLKSENEEFKVLGYLFQTSKKNALIVSPSMESYNRQFKILRDIKRQYVSNKNKKEYLRYKVELQIVGYVNEHKNFGWVNYFQSINDLSYLKHLDNWVIKNLEELRVRKTYLRAYHSIRNSSNEKNLRYLTKHTSNLELSPIEKKEILNSYYGHELDIMENIEEKFDMLHFKEVEKMEENFGKSS